MNPQTCFKIIDNSNDIFCESNNKINNVSVISLVICNVCLKVMLKIINQLDKTIYVVA